MKQKFFHQSPPVGDLPPAPRLGRVLGPGVIILATAMGSGEILFWPGIASTYGFSFLWLALPAIFIQYVLNTEFARYTLATGETVVRGFGRLWGGWSWFLLAAATLPWLWPGWAMGGAVAATWVVGGSAEWIATGSLVAIGLVLTTRRAVYKTVELTQIILMAVIVVFGVGVAAFVVREPTLEAMQREVLLSPLPLPAALSIFTLLSALAFSGAGGSINLATSNWIRDKGLGMAVHAPKITNPFSGEVQAVEAPSWRFAATEENKSRWSAWWAVAQREQFWTFLVAGSLGLILFMAIAHALVGGQVAGVGMAFLKGQADALTDRSGAWLGLAYTLTIAAIFLTSAIGVLDHAARLAAGICVSLFFPRATEATGRAESLLYFILLWTMIGFGCLVILGFDVSSPPTLLTIAGSLSGIVMFVYSVLTIILVHKMRQRFQEWDAGFADANPFRLPLWRMVTLCAGALLYGAFSVLAIKAALETLL